jgi:hypothetical protein
VDEVICNIPLTPLPTVVVLESVNRNAPIFKVVPSPTVVAPETLTIDPVVNTALLLSDKVPPTHKVPAVVAVAEPLNERFPVTDVIAPKVSAPPLKVRLEYEVTTSVWPVPL